MQGAGDAAGDGVEFDADEAVALLALAHEIPGAAAWLQDGRGFGHAHVKETGRGHAGMARTDGPAGCLPGSCGSLSGGLLKVAVAWIATNFNERGIKGGTRLMRIGPPVDEIHAADHGKAVITVNQGPDGPGFELQGLTKLLERLAFPRLFGATGRLFGAAGQLFGAAWQLGTFRHELHLLARDQRRVKMRRNSTHSAGIRNTSVISIRLFWSALGVTQLDATANVGGANVPGSFSYTLADGATPAGGAILNVGQHQVLNVIFTPAGSTDYTTAASHVEINVAPPAPTANSDTFVLGPGGAVSGSDATSVLANDVSVDGQPQNLTATLVSTTTNGSLTLHSDGSFTYTPGSTFQGIDRFSYQLHFPRTRTQPRPPGSTSLVYTGTFYGTARFTAFSHAWPEIHAFQLPLPSGVAARLFVLSGRAPTQPINQPIELEDLGISAFWLVRKRRVLRLVYEFSESAADMLEVSIARDACCG